MLLVGFGTRLCCAVFGIVVSVEKGVLPVSCQRAGAATTTGKATTNAAGGRMTLSSSQMADACWPEFALSTFTAKTL